MDTPFNFLQSHHAKSADELKSALLYTRMELEMTKLAAEEELKRRDDQLALLTHLLNRAIRDRDEALAKSHNILLLLGRSPAPLSGVSSVDDDHLPSNTALSPSDCEDSIVSSPAEEVKLQLVPRKPLPEKGKLLQAVVKAGPLLQTLLLAGPLPQWRHPPPPLEAEKIPPVGIGGRSDESSPRPYRRQRTGS